MPLVDAEGPKPPYLQIADDLRRRIQAGEWHAGARVPSSRELMSEYGVASMTVHQAIKVLRDEGVVVSYPGRGVYVADSSSTASVTPAPNADEIEKVHDDLERLKDQLRQTATARDITALQEEIVTLRQQVGRIEANLIDLYGKVGQPYPHGRQQTGSGEASTARQRKVSNG